MFRNIVNKNMMLLNDPYYVRKILSFTNMSIVRQNFHEACEGGINRQINMELHACYAYLAMASHFDRDDVSFPNAVKFFKKASAEEMEHAQKLIDYQNKRGGRVMFQDIPKPVKTNFTTLCDAFETALDLEKKVNESLLGLFDTASGKNDAQFQDFLSSEYLLEQVEGIKKISEYVTNLRRVGPGLGEYLFDRETLKDA